MKLNIEQKKLPAHAKNQNTWKLPEEPKPKRTWQKQRSA
jgi:hypothetical protein